MITKKEKLRHQGKQCIADGSTQRSYNRYGKVDGYSPTVMIESVFIIEVTDAREKQAITVLDVANAFLYTHNDKWLLFYCTGS